MEHAKGHCAPMCCCSTECCLCATVLWFLVERSGNTSTICSHAQNVSRTLQKPDPKWCACEQLMCAGACLWQEMPTSDMTLTVVLLLPPLTDPVQVDLIDHSHYHHGAHHRTETCAENPQAL